MQGILGSDAKKIQKQLCKEDDSQVTTFDRDNYG